MASSLARSLALQCGSGSLARYSMASIMRWLATFSMASIIQTEEKKIIVCCELAARDSEVL